MYTPRNREKSRRPRNGLFWCTCDMAKVSNYQKCPVCGSRTGKKREKFKKGTYKEI